MPIKLIRIDDRYIHGQVTVSWVNHYRINEIWVVDDKIATNPVLKQLQLALAPPNVVVKILSVKEAIEEAKKSDKNPNNIMIITPNAVIALRLIKEGNIKIDWINAGQSAWNPGKIILVKSFAASQDDINAFKELHAMGIKIIYQMLANESPQDLIEILKKKGLL